ncbi:MAG: GtrA family protein [Bacteroidales bacterium]|nr:GtrA family protein [Bacteroidales bacterium]
MQRSDFNRIIKFGIVGCSGTLVDFGVTFVCKELLGILPLISNALGFTIAATTNYLLNRTWTWRSKEKQVGVEYAKFFAVSLLGLGLNTLIIYLLTQKMSWSFLPDAWQGYAFWIAKVIATGVVMVWNFLANNFFTFKKKA